MCVCVIKIIGIVDKQNNDNNFNILFFNGNIELLSLFGLSTFLLIIIVLSDIPKSTIGLVGRVFANGPGDLGSIPGRVIPKT